MHSERRKKGKGPGGYDLKRIRCNWKPKVKGSAEKLVNVTTREWDDVGFWIDTIVASTKKCVKSIYFFLQVTD